MSLLARPSQTRRTTSCSAGVKEVQPVAGRLRSPRPRWISLTPAEQEVVRLVCDGLPNKDIATKLFVSPRTVQAHLTHVYAKLGIASRVQLVQEAALREG